MHRQTDGAESSSAGEVINEAAETLSYAPARVRQPLDRLTVRPLVCAALFLPCLYAAMNLLNTRPALGMPAAGASFILAILAIVCGFRSPRSGRAHGGRNSVANLSILLGILELLLAAFFALFVPASRAALDETKCASNLRQIGQGLLMYAEHHSGNFPPDFTTLVSTEDLPAFVFECPDTADAPISGPNGQPVIGPGSCSYVYVRPSKKLAEIGPNDVLAYEPVSNHARGANFLFGDGRVEWLRRWRAKKLIAELENRPATGSK